MFDIKTLKKTPFLKKHLPNSTKNRGGDADFTPLRVAVRRREKYYTKQFSKVGKSVVWYKMASI